MIRILAPRIKGERNIGESFTIACNEGIKITSDSMKAVGYMVSEDCQKFKKAPKKDLKTTPEGVEYVGDAHYIQPILEAK